MTRTLLNTILGAAAAIFTASPALLGADGAGGHARTTSAAERHAGVNFRPTPGRDFDPPLFLDAQIPQNAALPHDLYDGVLSSRPVRMNAAALNPDLGPNRAFDLDLTDNRRFTLVLDSCEVRGPKNYTWRGHIDGWNESDIVLSCYEDAVAAEITLAPLWRFSLRYLGDGLHLLTEIDPFKPWQCGTPDEPAPMPRAAKPASPPTAPPSGPQDIDYIGVTILYPQVVQNLSGGPSGIAAQCQLCCDQMNDALSNSWSDKRVSLLWHAVIDFDESDDYSDMLNRFGDHPVARNYRFANGADLVAMLSSRVQGSGLGVIVGRANLMGGGQGFIHDCDNTDRCWSVTNYRAATDSYTFAHELGHNLGCGHGYGNGGGLFAASQGYRFDINGVYYKTIMAYDELGFRIGIKHFSNPDVQYTGTFGSRHPTGDNDHANAWTINTTGWYASVYRYMIGGIYGKPPEGGNYNGQGWSTCPYRDFAHLQRFVVPNGTIRLHPGEYLENPTFSNPGWIDGWAEYPGIATIGTP